jgi:uncharacterized membrane protein
VAEEKRRTVFNLWKSSEEEKQPKPPANAPQTSAVDNDPGSNVRHGRENPESVRIQRGILGLITTPEIGSETEQEIKARRELNEVVHRMLILGLVLSTLCLFAGLGLSAITHHALPSKVSGLRQILDGLKRASPPSFLNLGILLLIATPVLRVLGSLVEFAEKRDWRYVLVTSVVLIILAISVAVGSR